MHVLPLLFAEAEVIKRRQPIGFRPHADHPRFSEGRVVPRNVLLAVESDGEMIAHELDAQMCHALEGTFISVRFFEVRFPLSVWSRGIVCMASKAKTLFRYFKLKYLLRSLP